jgi:hypothetical protein
MKLFLFSLLFALTWASDSGLSGKTSDADTTSISSTNSGDSGDVKMAEEDLDEQLIEMFKEDFAPVPRIYPTVTCSLKEEDHKFYSAILSVVPSFRSPDIFTVKTMQDFRYIVVVLKPQTGPLFRYFRMEYDWTAIRADCKDLEDEAEFQRFIQMI